MFDVKDSTARNLSDVNTAENEDKKDQGGETLTNKCPHSGNDWLNVQVAYLSLHGRQARCRWEFNAEAGGTNNRYFKIRVYYRQWAVGSTLFLSNS